MPRPVEALPCGSRSTISTFSPIAASAVPRLIAVVVLPTPPFWLATARTRGCIAPFGLARLGVAGKATTSADWSEDDESLIAADFLSFAIHFVPARFSVRGRARRRSGSLHPSGFGLIPFEYSNI